MSEITIVKEKLKVLIKSPLVKTNETTPLVPSKETNAVFLTLLASITVVVILFIFVASKSMAEWIKKSKNNKN